MVQWLRLCASTAWSEGWITGQGTKIPQAAQCSKKLGGRRGGGLGGQGGRLSAVGKSHEHSWIFLDCIIPSLTKYPFLSPHSPHPAPPPASANCPRQLVLETWTLACSNLAHLMACASKYYSSAVQVASCFTTNCWLIRA